MKNKIKSTPFFPPYNAKGEYNLKATGRGVYLIKKGESVIYVGQSGTDVRKTLYRHFQKWTDRRTQFTKNLQNYERVTYEGQNRNLFKIKVIFCKTLTDMDNLEFLLIKKYKPRDNTNKMLLIERSTLEKTIENLNDADAWKPFSEENPF